MRRVVVGVAALSRSVSGFLPKTMCVEAPQGSIDFCNATSSGLCVNSTEECDVMGGRSGNGDAGCGDGCFCCKDVRWTASCPSVGTAAIDSCHAKHRGLCMANADDCDAVGGAFSENGCGSNNDCGCCRGVGDAFRPTGAPTRAPPPSPSPGPSAEVVEEEEEGGGGGGGDDDDDRETLLALVVFFAALNVCCIASVVGAYGFYRRRARARAEAREVGREKSEKARLSLEGGKLKLWHDPPPPPPDPPRGNLGPTDFDDPASPSSGRSASSQDGVEMVPSGEAATERDGFVVGDVRLDDL